MGCCKVNNILSYRWLMLMANLCLAGISEKKTWMSIDCITWNKIKSQLHTMPYRGGVNSILTRFGNAMSMSSSSSRSLVAILLLLVFWRSVLCVSLRSLIPISRRLINTFINPMLIIKSVLRLSYRKCCKPFKIWKRNEMNTYAIFYVWTEKKENKNSFTIVSSASLSVFLAICSRCLNAPLFRTLARLHESPAK